MVVPKPYRDASAIADRVAGLATELDEVLEPGGSLWGC